MSRWLDIDHWREIGAALAANKLRTFLTAFGVFWGIFLLMVMLGAGEGLENGVVEDFSDGAANCFFLWTRPTSKPYAGLPAGRRFHMRNADIEAIRREVPGAGVIAPRNQLGGHRGANNVIRGEHAGAFGVMGDYPEITVMESVELTHGRFLNDLDIRDKRKVAVIGSRAYELLFEEGEEPIGESIQVNGVYFKVVGVFGTDSGGDRGDRSSQTIFIPFTTFQRAFNYGDVVGWFAITSKEGVRASVVEADVRTLLAKRHRIDPTDVRAFGSFNLEEEFLKIKGLFFGINLLIWIVGIGTLAAGTIGVSNIMLVIVRERTKEIGIRRALGATPWAVVSQILAESLLLTGIAGYAGLIAGMALMDWIAKMLPDSGGEGAFRNPGVDLQSARVALTVLVVSGILAGLIPAIRAVRVRPVEALRAD